MGWTCTQSHGRSALDHVCAVEGIDRERLVAHNTGPGGRTLYIAYRCPWPDGRVDVVGIVVLVDRRKDDGVWTKVMEETMGPYYYGASAKVLDALTPTASAEANAWRTKCREALADRAAQRERAKAFVVGAVITVTREIKLSGGSRSIHAGSRCRIVAVMRGGGLVIGHPSLAMSIQLRPSTVAYYTDPAALDALDGAAETGSDTGSEARE